MLTFINAYSFWGMWFLQFTVGIIFIVHGLPKLKNIKNVFGIGGLIHGCIEVVGASALIFNYQVQIVGLVFAIIMLGAILFKKFKWHISFMSQDKTGWEFDFVLLAANIFFFLH